MQVNSINASHYDYQSNAKKQPAFRGYVDSALIREIDTVTLDTMERVIANKGNREIGSLLELIVEKRKEIIATLCKAANEALGNNTTLFFEKIIEGGSHTLDPNEVKFVFKLKNPTLSNDRVIATHSQKKPSRLYKPEKDFLSFVETILDKNEVSGKKVREIEAEMIRDHADSFRFFKNRKQEALARDLRLPTDFFEKTI